MSLRSLPVVVLAALAIGAAWIILHVWMVLLVLSLAWTLYRHYLRPTRTGRR